jgi:hypothetical protein
MELIKFSLRMKSKDKIRGRRKVRYLVISHEELGIGPNSHLISCFLSTSFLYLSDMRMRFWFKAMYVSFEAAVRFLLDIVITCLIFYRFHPLISEKYKSFMYRQADEKMKTRKS